MITTTLNRIKSHNPCNHGWRKLLAGLGKTRADNKPLPYSEILRINGLDDALWAARCEPQHHRVWRLLAVQFARNMQHSMHDQRSIDALDVAERHANGLATDTELAAAREAAWSATWDAARDAAEAVAWPAAEAAARAAARAAAWAAAWAAARAAAEAAAWAAAWAVARAAAEAAAWELQSEQFLAAVGDTQ